MVIYEYTKKKLVIPAGLGNLNTNNGATSGDCSEAIAEAYQSGITAGAAQQKALLTSTAITQNGTYTRENGWNSVRVNVSHQNIYYPIVISGTFVTSQDVTINEPYHLLGYDSLNNIEIQSLPGGASHYIFIDGISAIDINSARIAGSPITFTAGTHTYQMECNGAWVANAPYETFNSLSNFQFGDLQPSGISNVNIKLFINKEQ